MPKFYRAVEDLAKGKYVVLLEAPNKVGLYDNTSPQAPLGAMTYAVKAGKKFPAADLEDWFVPSEVRALATADDVAAVEVPADVDIEDDPGFPLGYPDEPEMKETTEATETEPCVETPDSVAGRMGFDLPKEKSELKEVDWEKLPSKKDKPPRKWWWKK